MLFYFNDMFGNYVYDSVVNDTEEISNTLYRALKARKKEFEDKSVQVEFDNLVAKGFFPEKKHAIQSMPLS